MNGNGPQSGFPGRLRQGAYAIAAVVLTFLAACTSNRMKDDKASGEGDAIQKFTEYMEELKNRKIYRALNPQILESIPNDKLEQAIRDFIALKIDKDWAHDVQKVPSLGPGFSAVYFVAIVEAEVNNGGFNQLFWNSGREAVVHAKAGADLMELHELSRVLEEALQVEEKERHKMARFKQVGTMEALMESYDEVSFEAVDDQLLALSSTLEGAIVLFIRKHPHLFEGKVDD